MLREFVLQSSMARRRYVVRSDLDCVQIPLFVNCCFCAAIGVNAYS